MDRADARLQASIMMSSSMRFSFVGGHVGCDDERAVRLMRPRHGRPRCPRPLAPRRAPPPARLYQEDVAAAHGLLQLHVNLSVGELFDLDGAQVHSQIVPHLLRKLRVARAREDAEALCEGRGTRHRRREPRHVKDGLLRADTARVTRAGPLEAAATCTAKPSTMTRVRGRARTRAKPLGDTCTAPAGTVVSKARQGRTGRDLPERTLAGELDGPAAGSGTGCRRGRDARTPARVRRGGCGGRSAHGSPPRSAGPAGRQPAMRAANVSSQPGPRPHAMQGRERGCGNRWPAPSRPRGSVDRASSTMRPEQPDNATVRQRRAPRTVQGRTAALPYQPTRPLVREGGKTTTAAGLRQNNLKRIACIPGASCPKVPGGETAPQRHFSPMPAARGPTAGVRRRKSLLTHGLRALARLPNHRGPPARPRWCRRPMGVWRPRGADSEACRERQRVESAVSPARARRMKPGEFASLQGKA